MKIKFSAFSLILIVFLMFGCAVSGNELRGDSKMKKDSEIVLKKIFSHAEVQKFIHPEVAGRIPIKVIVTDDMSLDYSIKQFGENIIFIRKHDGVEDDPLFVIHTFAISDENAYLIIKYPIEGLVIESSLKKHDKEWSVEKISIIEQ